VPELCRGRVGHVLQRPLHRAGNQAGARLHVGAVADRARVRGPGRQEPGRSRGAVGADDRRRQGVGADPDHRAADVLGPAHRAGRRGGPDRVTGCVDRGATRTRRPRARPRHDRSETDAGRGAGRHLPHWDGGGGGAEPGRRRRVHRRLLARPTGGERRRAGWHRVSDRCRCAVHNDVRPSIDAGHRRRAQEPGAVRLGQRQPPPLLPSRQGVADTDRSWLEQLVTRRVRLDDVDQALARAPDDIKVIIEFEQP
jgi:hypothetical protein